MIELGKDKKEIIRNNPMVDENIITQYEKLDAELRRLGVDIRPKFNITPALGGERLHRLMNEAMKK